MCKMSVTHGGVFAALQSSRHAHVSLSFSLSPSLSLSDLLLRLDEEWEALSRKREQQPPLHSLVWCFMQKSVAAPFFSTQGTRTSYTSSGRKEADWGFNRRRGWSVFARRYVQIYNLPRGLRSLTVLVGRCRLFGPLVRSVQQGQDLRCDPARLERLSPQESLDHPAVKTPRHVSALYDAVLTKLFRSGLVYRKTIKAAFPGWQKLHRSHYFQTWLILNCIT